MRSCRRSPLRASKRYAAHPPVMEVFIFIKEISKAAALLTDIRAEVKTALDLIKGQCSTTAPTIVLLSDALRRIDKCAALPSAEDKADPPPVKMEIMDGNRRFNAAFESGEIP